MKRLLALLLVGLVAVACSPDEDTALTVGGDDVLTVGDLEDELQDMRGHHDFLTVVNARGAGSDTLRAGFVSEVVLTNHARVAVLDDELAELGIELTEDDIAAGTELMATDLANAGQQALTPDELPPSYRQLLIDVYSRFSALAATFGDDPATTLPQAGERLQELMLDAEVDVAGRYGSWNPEEGRIVAPEGPATPTTAPLLPGG